MGESEYDRVCRVWREAEFGAKHDHLWGFPIPPYTHPDLKAAVELFGPVDNATPLVVAPVEFSDGDTSVSFNNIDLTRYAGKLLETSVYRGFYRCDNSLCPDRPGVTEQSKCYTCGQLMKQSFIASWMFSV